MTATGCFKEKVLLLETIFQKIGTQLLGDKLRTPLHNLLRNEQLLRAFQEKYPPFLLLHPLRPGTDRSDETKIYGRNRDNRDLQDATRSARIIFLTPPAPSCKLP